MLEKCKDLLGCEETLSGAFKSVTLLGEIPIKDQDLKHLSHLISNKIKLNIPRGTRWLEKWAPATLSIYLVWMGIVHYQEGNFWSSVERATGLSDPNWQARWGKIFLNFLKKNRLPLFEIEGALAYVVPILLHGGIPNSCLEDFFRSVLKPLVERELLDPLDPEEVIYVLRARRDDQDERSRIERKLEEKIREREKIIRRIKTKTDVIEAFDDILLLWEKETASEDLRLISDLPENVEDYINEKRREYHELQVRTQEAERRKSECEEIIKRLSQRDKEIIANAEAIEGIRKQAPQIIGKRAELKDLIERGERSLESIDNLWKGISNTSWNDEYGDVITKIPLDQLSLELDYLEIVLYHEDDNQDAIEESQTTSDPPSPLRLALPVFLSMIGILLIALGFAGEPIWLLMLIGLIFLAISVVKMRSWDQEYMLWKNADEADEKQTDTITTEAQDVINKICKLISDLPVSDEVLVSSPGVIYPTISSIIDRYGDLQANRENAKKLKREDDQYQLAFEQMASMLNVNVTHDLESTADEMFQALRNSVDRKREVEDAIEKLETEITPELQDLKAEEDVIRKDVVSVSNRLKELGQGSIQAGHAHVQRILKKHVAFRGAKVRIESLSTDLAILEDEVQAARNHGKDKEELRREVHKLVLELETVEREVQIHGGKLTTYPSVFQGIDEPIRRYLIFGGKGAEEFLINAVKLMHHYSQVGTLPEDGRFDLPERVVEAFTNWWEREGVWQSFELDQVPKTEGQRLTAPIFSFDPETVEVMVHFRPQRILPSQCDDDVCLEILAEDDGQLKYEFPLRLYKLKQDLLETQEREIPLPFPAGKYEIRLRNSTQEIHCWELKPPGEGRAFFAFKQDQNRLIKDESLPKGVVWFLLHRDYSLAQSDCVMLDGGRLKGQWKEYAYYKLDLEDVEELKLISKHTNRPIDIPLMLGEPSSIDLINGQMLIGVSSEGNDVYTGAPPALQVPLQDETALRFWHLSLITGEISSPQGKKHVRLSDLVEAVQVDSERGRAEILLSDERLLGPTPFGTYQIRLHKSPYADWRRTIAFVPMFDYQFNREIYFPRQPRETIFFDMKLCLSNGYSFIPDVPVKEVSSEETRVILKGKTELDIIPGTISPRDGGKNHNLPLTITIPKLRWRFQGVDEEQYTTWNDTVEEVWLGAVQDEVTMLIETPLSLEGSQLSIGLGTISDKQGRASVEHGRASYDLAPFSEVFSSGPSLQTIFISREERDTGLSFKDVALVNCRTRWEAEDLQCVQSVQGQNLILEMIWCERGKLLDKVLTLWSLMGHSNNPIMKQYLRAEVCQARLVLDANKLPPGQYLLHLKQEDPWSSTVEKRPAKDAPNTLLVEIVSTGDLRKGQIFTIESVQDEVGRKWAIARNYQITILGKVINRQLPSVDTNKRVLVTPANEGWYVGRLDVTGKSYFKLQIDLANPVKFEYILANGYVSAIEDRFGDGAMYCADCKLLFWNERKLRSEERRKHRLYGPIEVFHIKWED